MQKIFLIFILTTSFAFGQSQTGGGSIVSPGCSVYTQTGNKLLEIINKSYKNPKRTSPFEKGEEGLGKFYEHLEKLIIKVGLEELNQLTINKDKKKCGGTKKQQQIIKDNPWITDKRISEQLKVINLLGSMGSIKCSSFEYHEVQNYIEFLELWVPEDNKSNETEKIKDNVIDRMHLLNNNKPYGG